MIKEYETHRIPEDVVVNPEVEYLTFCSDCKKDLIVPIDYPSGNYYCRNCSENVSYGPSYAAEKRPAPGQHDNVILSKRPPVTKSNKRFSKAVIFFMIALTILMVRVAIELGSSPNKEFEYGALLWTSFTISVIATLFFIVWALMARKDEKNSGVGKPSSGY